jgi:hypothetical protein
VDPDDVSVDLVDVLVKDQYVSRNDMWRLSKALVGQCVYVPKKVSFSGIRGQINELWKKGEQKTCGVISKNTRVSIISYKITSQTIFHWMGYLWGRFPNTGNPPGRKLP